MSDQKKPEPSDAALQARLSQLELENRMRHRLNSVSSGADPFKDTPRKGFGSAQGIAHLRHTEYQRRGPNPPAPPPSIPEPGKAKFGGTYLRTPLPGVLSGSVQNPWEVMIAPTPAGSSVSPDEQRDRPALPAAGAGVPPVAKGSDMSSATPPLPTADVATNRASAFQPPKRQTSETSVAQPPSSPLETTRTKVVGGGGVPKAPLPALYHAGLKSAEDSEKKREPVSEPVLEVPKEAEVRTDEVGKAPRVKRFKNPTLGS